MSNIEKPKGSLIRVKMIALSRPVRYSIEYVNFGKENGGVKPKMPKDFNNVSLEDMTALSKHFETVELMEGQVPFDGKN